MSELTRRYAPRLDNLPDDWDNFWATCCRCGARYHLSEGDCGCADLSDDGRVAAADEYRLPA